MLKLTTRQLRTATAAALNVGWLEAAKDQITSEPVSVTWNSEQGLFGGSGLAVGLTVPATVIRHQIDTLLQEAHQKLRELGIELVP